MSKRVLEYLLDHENKEVTKSIGEQVKQYRKQARMTQQELAKRSGITQGMISKIERGALVEIGAITLTKIGCALEIRLTPWWLQL